MWLLTVKVIIEQGKAKVLINFQRRKCETAMAHKYKTQKCLVHTCQNVSYLLLRLKSQLEKDAISVGPKKDFLPSPHHWQLKHHQRTNINKTMLSTSPSSTFHTNFTTRIEKLVSIPIQIVIELGLPVSESSTRISEA